MEWLPAAALALPQIIAIGSQLRTAIDTTQWAASWIQWGISGDPESPPERWQWIEAPDAADDIDVEFVEEGTRDTRETRVGNGDKKKRE